MIHFDGTITITGAGTVGTLVILLWRIETWGRRHFTEHEILVRDYCERKGIKLSDLPTRLNLFGVRGR